MASLPGIVIRVTSETADAIRGLNRVNSAMGKTTTGADKFQRGMKVAGKALAGLAAGVGAVATAVAVDAVQAFMEEQKEVERLTKTLDNLDLEGRTKDVTDWADSLQYAANVTDSDLRDSFEKLVRTTGNVDKAMLLTQQSLDVAAGTGADLSTVVDALTAGYAGNKRGILNLKTGIDKATIAASSMDEIMAILQKTMGGQAASQAGTLSSSVEGVSIAVDELKESFGAGLVGNIDDANAKLKETEDRLRDLQPEAERAGGAIRDLGLNAAEAAGRAIDVYSGETPLMQRLLEWMTMGMAPDDVFNPTADSLDNAARAAGAAADRMTAYAKALQAAKGAQDGFTGSPPPAVNAAGETWADVDARLKGARTQYAWRQMDARNARRKAARAAKKERRAAAVREARAAELTRKRAQARTGQNLGAQKSTRGQRSCA